MINFAHIKRVAQYDKVNYYSVVLNNDKKSMFERFIDVHQKSKALDEAFKQKNITWNDSFSDIIYQDEFKISF